MAKQPKPYFPLSFINNGAEPDDLSEADRNGHVAGHATGVSECL